MSDAYQLENVPIFRNVPSGQLEPLRKAAIRQVYKAGAAIFRQGDIPSNLYIVEEGAVDIVLPTMSEDVTLASFETGSFFGELAVFDHQPRTATARAATDTSVICIPLAAMAELIEGHPAAAKQFMSIIIERLRGADEMLSRNIRNINELADQKMTVGERIADVVARQAAKDRLQADQDYQVNIKAEFAIQQLHRKLDEMRASLMQHRRAEAEHWRKVERP